MVQVHVSDKEVGVRLPPRAPLLLRRTVSLAGRPAFTPMTAEPFPKPAAGAQGRPQPEHAPGGPPATPSFGRLLAASLRTVAGGPSIMYA